jgi:hypothetical protein
VRIEFGLCWRTRKRIPKGSGGECVGGGPFFSAVDHRNSQVSIVEAAILFAIKGGCRQYAKRRGRSAIKVGRCVSKHVNSIPLCIASLPRLTHAVSGRRKIAISVCYMSRKARSNVI